MKKNYFILAAIASVALASCSNEEYIGEYEGAIHGEKAISFNLTTPSITRAETGATAAATLNSNFVLSGFKTTPTVTRQVVFDNYQANYTANTAYTTESNSSNWEYVGFKNVPGGVTTNAGVTSFAASNNNTNAIDQTIKYWDFTATGDGYGYDFMAYSLGKGTGTTPTYATASKIEYKTSPAGYTYSLTGSNGELAACYISNITKKQPSATDTHVQFNFRAFNSKVRLGLFETIPGYSVTDVKFYVDSSTKSTGSTANDGLAATLFDAGTTASLPNGGTYDITFDASGIAIVTFKTETGDNPSYASSIGMGALSGFVKREYKEVLGTTTNPPAETDEDLDANKIYLGRESTSATKTDYSNFLPNPTGTELTLKIDYTLVSRDGTNEKINVTGATAKVPKEFTQWKSGFAYTYLFKITDDQLVPITLDAVVEAVEEDGKVQETITTVSEPSITTFGVKDSKYVAGGNEYAATSDVYATIYSGNAIVDPTDKYYVFTASTNNVAFPVTEASIADAIVEKAVRNVDNAHITYNSYTTNVTLVTTIPGEDGNDITLSVGKAIKMASLSANTYVVAYKKTAGSASASTEAYDATKTYYSTTADTYGFYPITTVAADDLNGGVWKNDEAKAKYTTAPTQPVYIYKVIKVQ